MYRLFIFIASLTIASAANDCITISDVRVTHDNNLYFTSGLGLVDKVWVSF